MRNLRVVLTILACLALFGQAQAQTYTDAPQISESGSSTYASIAHTVNSWKASITSAVGSRSAIMDQVENCMDAAAKDVITELEYDALAEAIYYWLNKAVDEAVPGGNPRVGWDIKDINIGASYFTGTSQCIWRLVNTDVPFLGRGVSIPTGGRIVLFVADYQCEPGNEHVPSTTPLTGVTIRRNSSYVPVMFQTAGTGKVLFFGRKNRTITVTGEKTWGDATSYTDVLARSAEVASSSVGQLVYANSGTIKATYSFFKNNVPSPSHEETSPSITTTAGNWILGGAIGLTDVLGTCSFYKTDVSNNAINGDFGGGIGIAHVTNIVGDGIYFNHCTFNGNLVAGRSDLGIPEGAHGGAVGVHFDYYGIVDAKKIFFKNTTFKNNCQASDIEAHGGAIFYRDMGRGCEIANCSFNGNYAHGLTAGGGALSNEGHLSITNTVFEHNMADNSFGGAIYVRPVMDSSKDSKYVGLTLSGCTFRNNTCTWTGIPELVTADSGSAEIERGSGGAILIDVFKGLADPDATKYEVNMDLNNNCIFENNTADRNGGAIAIVTMQTMKDWIATHASQVKSSLNVNSASISSNSCGADKTWLPAGSAYNLGGAIYLSHTTLNVTSDAVSIFSNSALKTGGKGGGAYIDNAHLRMSGGKIGLATKGNKALIGGGVFIKGGDLIVTGGDISYNEATVGDSGAVHVEGGNVSITNGNISNNLAAQNGGAFSVTLGTVTLTNGTIKNNHAVGDGGGFYHSGGVASISNGSISDNTAVDGGAFYVADGSLTVTQGHLEGNASSRNGGGIFVSGGTTSISGGSIKQNVASGDGGGFYCTGGLVEFTGDGSGGFGFVTNNTGRNGGAVFLTNGASMTIQEAMITHNNAIVTEPGKIPTTAYHGVAATGTVIQGKGGGVYVGHGPDASHKTVLRFLKKGGMVASLGIYDNRAAVGADEIFADGLNTEIYIPSITDMDLSGYAGTANNWYEDYLTDDISYSDGTKTDVVRTTGKTAIRYRSATDPALYNADLDTPETRYICLALGLRYGQLIIKKKGLKAGESAIFVLTNGSYKRTAILTGINDDGREVSVTLSRMEIGTWHVAEDVSWSWAYSTSTPSEDIELIDSTVKTLSFTNTSKSGTPSHDEAKKINNITY